MSKKKVETIDYEPAMSFAEIAHELAVSQTRVMELYSSGMKKLIDLVKDQADLEEESYE